MYDVAQKPLRRALPSGRRIATRWKIITPIAALFAVALALPYPTPSAPPVTIGYTQLLQLVSAGRVADLESEQNVARTTLLLRMSWVLSTVQQTKLRVLRSRRARRGDVPGVR